MMDDINSLVENLINAETVIDEYKQLIYFLLLFSYGIYKKHIKHRAKTHPMSCECDPEDIFSQMRTYREHIPDQCGAGKSCISNALFDLVQSINNATESIVIAMPEFTIEQLLDCICASANSFRLVDVRIILNYSEGLENSQNIKKLLDKDIDVRFADKPINNAFCLIDPELFHSDVVIDTPIWTHSAIYKKNGYMRFVSHERSEREFKEMFDSMWKKSKSPSAIKSYFEIFVSKLKLKRRLLFWSKRMYCDLRDGYWYLRLIRRPFRALTNLR